MKKQIKRILINFGVWHSVIRIYSDLLYVPYANSKTWKFNSNGIHLVYDTSDTYSRKWFYPRCRGQRIHEPITTKIFIDYVKPNDVVLDIGAHLGYFTCIAAELAHNGRVYAFDTDQKSCELIAGNAQLNNLNNIFIQHAAVTDKSGFIKIRNLEEPNPGLVINTKISTDSIEVKSISIDEFILRNNLTPNFIKIDVEGAEGLVVSGMQKTLQLKNLTLLVEIHVKQLTRYFDIDYRDIIKLLIANDFSIENINHRLKSSVFEKVNMDTILEGNTMLLCTKK